MKKITFLILALFLITSCGNDDDKIEETIVVNEDLSKTPAELKVNWKVDFYAYAAEPTFIGANNIGCTISFSESNLVSFKDIYSIINNKSAKYTNTENGYKINIDDIEIITKPSNTKIGYTQFHITYYYLPSRNCILFAKKQ